MEHVARAPGFALVMLAFALAEAFWRLRVVRRGYDVRAAWVSLALGAGNLAFGAAYAFAIGAVFATAARLAPLHWPLHDWRAWLAGFVLVEFAYYWFHRASHRVRWLWATHAIHHSPEQLTFLAAVRLGWTQLFSGGWLFYLPLVLLGFDPRMIFALLVLDLHYQFFLHTEAFGSWGPLERVLNTPTHHRVHHASNPAYLDCNYGGVVIVFDRLFGTLCAEKTGEPIRYGLAHPIDSKHPFAIAFGEWARLFAALRRADDWRHALRIALGPP